MKTYTERIFEEFVQNDNSPEAKLRRYLERKRRQREEFEMNRPHPQDRNELQYIIVKAIEKDGSEVDLNHIDVSGIEDMSYLFVRYGNEEVTSDNSTSLQHFNGDISEWDVSNVKDMRNMFLCCPKFNCDISEWDVGNVRDMSGMFYNTFKFNQKLEKWDVSKVEDMSDMFNFAYEFDQSIGGWDVSNVKEMSGMFKGAQKFNQDLSGWKDKIKNVKSMAGMFNGAKSFNKDLSMWDLSDVFTKEMFDDCPIKEEYKPKGLLE